MRTLIGGGYRHSFGQCKLSSPGIPIAGFLVGCPCVCSAGREGERGGGGNKSGGGGVNSGGILGWLGFGYSLGHQPIIVRLHCLPDPPAPELVPSHLQPDCWLIGLDIVTLFASRADFRGSASTATVGIASRTCLVISIPVCPA